MKRFLCIAIAFVAIAVFGVSQTQAQCCNNSGFSQNYGYNFNNSGFERPPHFALFPPVYYSNQIVRRPVGVSPFAATPGVVPVEMTAPVEPTLVKNPYYKPEAKPVTSGKLDEDT